MKMDISSYRRLRPHLMMGILSLLVGIILSMFHLPARAAGAVVGETYKGIGSTQAEVCTPPKDWGDTVRLFYKRSASTEWEIEIDRPVMEVTLELFYYQDHDPDGCPFDCSSGKCQLDEIGSGASPLGDFRVEDGKFGASGGVIKQKGLLDAGKYRVTFKATGLGSINVGLRVHKQAVPTAPPEPTLTSTPTPTEIVLPPTATEAPPTPTGTSQPPDIVITETPTPTDPVTTPPIATTGVPPTATATAEGPSPTPTKTPKPPATLSPPTPPPGTTQTPVLLPVTGADLTGGIVQPDRLSKIFINLAIGTLGLALIARGISRRLKQK